MEVRVEVRVEARVEVRVEGGWRSGWREGGGQGGGHLAVYVYQISTLHTLTLHDVLCQLCPHLSSETRVLE